MKRGKCLFKDCKCFLYRKDRHGKINNICYCGHGKIWHENMEALDKKQLIEETYKTKKSLTTTSVYISSLQKNIKELETDLSDLKDTTPKETKCIICLNNKSTIIAVPCGHARFCQDCICEWISKDKGCPICRQKIDSIMKVII